jgi:signal transduction histidine kinase/CheY-like chemotaxis protein
MRRFDIRARMLLAALLPVAMVSVLLAVVFLLVRFDDMQESYQQRTRSVARQLALASEYGLFSANQTQLQAVVRGALREPDVRRVAVLDGRGQILAIAGDDTGPQALAYGAQEDQVFDARRRLDTLAQPVFATGIKLDDLYQEATSRPDGMPAQLGQVLVTFSRQAVDARRQSMLLLGGLISLMGLIFGVVLAAGLSRGVIRPILRVTHMIERIGRGDFLAAAEVTSDAVRRGDPLRDLQENLRKMAERLGHAREDLEQQISTATQALREKKEEAEQATQAKSRFLAAASHDLRQPTHALGMFVTRLAQLPHDEQTRELIGNLELSVRAMQNLLDGLLDISRLEALAVQVKLAPFPLAGLLAQLRQDLAQTAHDKGLQLRICESAAWVMSDATLLYRILLNLVGNALRYTDHGGVLVACRLVNAGTKVQIQVWDSGIGIAPEHQQDVFKEFYQVGNPARDRDKGLGLGLSIVQRTAGLLNHPLTLVSRPGIGTRFAITLPKVAPATETVDALHSEHEQQDELQGAELLVIEDDALVRSALVGLLGGWGIQVHEAQGMAAAQQWVQRGLKPALILSDYRLQDGQNGIDVVQQLRSELRYAVPACLMSGDTDAVLMGAAQAAGLTLLHKPVRPAKLRNLLRRLLAGQPVEEDLR